MLTQIPWLLKELDNRIEQLDCISVGTIGRNRRPANELPAIDFDAAELARTVRKTLTYWVETIATRHSGRAPATLNATTTADMARWLAHNTAAIARLDLSHKGRHRLYDDISRIVGDNHQPGQVVKAINPIEKHFAGPCPTITGRDHDGTPRQCGRILFADTYDKTTICPDCHQSIDVETNRRQAAADRDLHTRNQLLETLDNIDEPVTAAQLTAWITSRRLRPRGWLADGTVTEHRTNNQAEPVYSLHRARKLRRKDEHLTHRKTPA
jgi:hypothetical protein